MDGDTALVLNEYRGYRGTIEYDKNGKMHGRIRQVKQPVSYTGSNIVELNAAFRASVDEYLVLCDELGIQPEDPYRGRLRINIMPNTHRAVARFAEANNMRQNHVIEIALREFLKNHTPKDETEDADDI